MLRINLLGAFQVSVGGKTAVFRTDALRVLLAYLAANQGVPQRRDTLAGLLSPDRPDKEALTYLRNRLARLRKAIGDETAVPPYLDIDRKQLALRTGDDIAIDVIQFEQHLQTVETHAHRQLAGCPTCMSHLQTAVSLIRGELLAGLNFPSDTWESWLLAQREHVHQRALDAMTLLREALIVKGEWTAVLDTAQRQLSIEPWLEAAYRAEMQAHYHLGDRDAALAQFKQCQQQLWDELGVEPDEETYQLRQQILDNALLFAALDTPNNLLHPTGRFFGREAEKTQLLLQLVDPNYRLITLVGTGGIGKTRLSIEVGKQVQSSFPDGVWFVPLEAIKGGAEQIKIAVGEAAGLGQDGKQLTGEQVIAILRDKKMLLIFDNCEAVLDDIGFVSEWIKRAPQIAILATSREPLNFQAESVMMLDGLPTGAAEISVAEALFAERAQMARDDFAVTADNLPHVRHICDLVDGSPLGISLAAAWVRRRSLAQIIEGIGQSLDFLSSRLRDVDPRHRSVRAVFETSWQLLTPDEQDVLAALSVFPTTFTAVSAQHVTNATLFDLDLLCEKSLLQQQHEPERYVMHSLLRQFAADKLRARADEMNYSFVAHFYQFANQHQADYAALHPEWGNLLTAVTKAHALQSWQTVLDLVAVLDEPWFRQIRFQDMRLGLTMASEAAKTLQDQPALAQSLLRLGEIEVELNDYATAETHLNDATQLLMRLEDGLGIAQGMYLNGRIKNEQAKDDDALSLFVESKRIFAEEEDWLGVAKNLNLIAISHAKKYADFETAHQFLEESINLQKQFPKSSTYIETLRNLARVKAISENFVEAEMCLVEAAKVSQLQNDRGEYAAVLYEQAILSKRRTQFDDALSYGYKSLTAFKALGSLRWEGLIKTQLGLFHQAKQEPALAIALLKEALAIFDELGDVYEQAYAYYYLHHLYNEIGQMQQSEDAKSRALHINLELKDAQLQKRLVG